MLCSFQDNNDCGLQEGEISAIQALIERLEEKSDRRRATPSTDECRHTHDVNQHEIEELRKTINGLKFYGESLKQESTKALKTIRLDLNKIQGDLNQKGAGESSWFKFIDTC